MPVRNSAVATTISCIVAGTAIGKYVGTGNWRAPGADPCFHSRMNFFFNQLGYGDPNLLLAPLQTHLCFQTETAADVDGREIARSAATE